MRELDENKGLPCSEQSLHIPFMEDDNSANLWSAVRNNSNNAWYCNATSGNVNNNNSYNRYRCVGCSELYSSIDSLDERWLVSEAECYKNKHHVKDAGKVHYGLGKLIRFVNFAESGSYEPSAGICFVLDYPVYREVFAAAYMDRIVHHYVAQLLKLVTETAHTASGDVSHGNRLEHSAHTAALQIAKNLKEITNDNHKEAWIGRFDIKGFFMSIDRDLAWKMFLSFFEETDTSGLSQEYIDKALAYLDVLIHSNPTHKAERISPLSAWDNVAHNKSLFYASEGIGMPIGNYYSQLIANLFLARVDKKIASMPNVGYTRFVDDICVVAKTKEDVQNIRNDINEELIKLGLRLHDKKLYLQPSHHGVSFCGRTIKGRRVYINDRVVRACTNAIREAELNPCEESSKTLLRRLNSYFGLMAHCRSYNIQKRLADRVLDNFNEWIYYKTKHERQIVWRIKNKYNDIVKSINNLKSIRYEIRKNHRRRIGLCRI